MARARKFSYRATVNFNQLNLPVEGDDFCRLDGFVEAMHKRPLEWSPYLIANEYICTRLGDTIGLPVPPCVFTFTDIAEAPVLFSELNFNAGDALPEVDADYCLEHLPVEYLIEKLCNDAFNVGVIDRAHANAAMEFLKSRKRQLAQLVYTHRQEFTGISKWEKPGELFI